MSLVTRKPVIRVSSQVLHKPDCTATDGQMMARGLKFPIRRGIYVAKTKALFSCTDTAGFLRMRLKYAVLCDYGTTYEPHLENIVFFCICKNKDAAQLRSNCEADQHLCFHYIDSTIPLLPKYQISSL